MDFRTYIKTVLDSDSSEWTRIGRPIFLQDHHLFQDGDGDGHIGDLHEHTMLFTLKSDLSISIATGLEHRKDYAADWYKSFPDATAHSDYADLLWNGRPIYRVLIVWVDGGRCCLPSPDHKLEVPEEEVDLVRLIDSLHGTHDFDRYLSGAGIKVVPGLLPD